MPLIFVILVNIIKQIDFCSQAIYFAVRTKETEVYWGT